MKHYEARPVDVCSTRLVFDLDEEGRVHNVAFTNGCNGNLKAIGKLVEGRPAKEVVSLLKGNTCGMNYTSCADQFARALEEAVAKG